MLRWVRKWLSGLHECRVLLDYDLSCLNSGRKAYFLKLSDNRAGSERGRSLGYNDIERCELSLLSGGRGHRRLKLLEELEGVDVCCDNRTLSVNRVFECLESGLLFRCLVNGQEHKVVLGHLEFSVSPTCPHRLDLLTGDTLHVDDCDNGVLAHVLYQLVYQILLPSCDVCHL